MGTIAGATTELGTAPVELPAMDASLFQPRGEATPTVCEVVRSDFNEWLLMMGSAPAPGRIPDGLTEAFDDAVRAADSPVRVEAVMAALNRWLLTVGGGDKRALEVVVGRVELDRCGTWVTLSCGAQPLPIVVRRAGWIDVRGQTGPSVGADESVEFGEDRVGLGPGDTLVLVTDAVTGARDQAGELFAEEALPESLLASTDLQANDLVERVVAAAKRHTRAGLPDAAAVLAIRVPDDDPQARLRAAFGAGAHAAPLPGYPVGEPHWTPTSRSSPSRRARFLLAPTAVSVPRGRRFITKVLHSWRLEHLVEIGDAEVITSELLGNAVRHGGDDVTVLVDYDGQRVRIAVGDGSRELPQSRRPDADDVHGRGLTIVEALASEIGVSLTVDGKRVWADIPVET
jgi:anti-sigma regulatory factor (Ser/Thr protein kinase)